MGLHVGAGRPAFSDATGSTGDKFAWQYLNRKGDEGQGFCPSCEKEASALAIRVTCPKLSQARTGDFFLPLSHPNPRNTWRPSATPDDREV